MANIVPIDLSDDGLRIVHAGQIKVGKHKVEYSIQMNPQLIANVIVEKARRKIIREQNWRHFQHPEEKVMAA